MMDILKLEAEDWMNEIRDEFQQEYMGERMVEGSEYGNGPGEVPAETTGAPAQVYGEGGGQLVQDRGTDLRGAVRGGTGSGPAYGGEISGG
jgi:hypothetical protein